MLLDTDLPYLEPLWLWLRKDPNLQVEFTEDSFFMPLYSLATQSEEAMKKNCPAPRALWILPGDTLAASNKEFCRLPGVHSFNIMIFVQCLGETFQATKREGVVGLTGQAMELFRIRKLVKKSVLEFYTDYAKKNANAPLFAELLWKRDQILYPNTEGNSKFLVTTSQFDVKIF